MKPRARASACSSGQSSPDDKQRAATYLGKVLGWPQADIADYLQCSTATVGVHVHRGITRPHQWIDWAGRIGSIVVAIGFAIGFLLPGALMSCRRPCSPSSSPRHSPGVPFGLQVAIFIVLAALTAAAAWWAVRARREFLVVRRERQRWQTYRRLQSQSGGFRGV